MIQIPINPGFFAGLVLGGTVALVRSASLTDTLVLIVGTAWSAGTMYRVIARPESP